MIKSPEKLIFDKLATTPSVAKYVGFNIYPLIAPQEVAVPFIVWRRSGVSREQTLSGPLRMVTTTLEVTMYHTDYELVRELADAVRAALDGWSGAVGNWTNIRLIAFQNESDGFAQLTGGELPEVYAVTQYFTVLWGPE